MAQHGRRRAYGQHFLRDQAVCDRIADTAIEEALKEGCASLLEIGPGKGAITEPLLTRLGHLDGKPLEFIVCEKDPRIAPEWAGRQGMRFEHADFLELDEARWLGNPPLAVVSNLPYSVGTAIVDRLARHHAEIPVMVLMFQAEVAQRLRAERGTKDWGSLSIWIQNRYDVKKLMGVAPGAFVPPPDVQSEVVVLRRRAKPWIDSSVDEGLWERLLKASFAHRRKMLRSGLPGDLRNPLVASGLDGTKRAEALDWDEWRRLFEATLAERAHRG